MKVRHDPPLVAQIVSPLFGLLGFAVSFNFVGFHGSVTDPDAIKAVIVLFSNFLPVIFAMLGYLFSHRFFAWCFHGVGYPKRLRGGGDHLWWYGMETLVVASTFLVVYFVIARLEMPPALGAVLSFGTSLAPVGLLVVSAFLYRKRRALFWIGFLTAAGSVGMLFLPVVSAVTP